MVNGPEIAIHVTGIKELDDFLKTLEVNIAKRGTRVATKKVAQMVVADAKKIAPVKTGALRDAIRVGRKAPDRKYGSVEAGHSVTVGQGLFRGDQYYAGMLEFGTKERHHKIKVKPKTIREAWSGPRYTKGKNTGRIDANKWQFLREALYRNRQAKNQVFIAEIKRWIESFKKRQIRNSFEGRVARIESRLNKRIAKKQRAVKRTVKAFRKRFAPKPARKRARK